MRPLRYGSIRYVNNLPADWGLTSGRSSRQGPHVELEVVHGVPTALNRALAAGELDIATVSAGSLAPGGTLHDIPVQVLPEATIASRGPVESVLLVSQVPFRELDGQTIHVSDQSATGALLLRILLERDLGIRPRYRSIAIEEPAADEAPAFMVIGDQALEAQARSHAFGNAHVLDLGEAWRAYSGLPMVYALWVVRDALLADRSDDVEAFRHALDASVEWGTANRRDVLAEAARRTRLDETRISTYYDRLTHRLGDAERRGLQRFLEEAAELDAPGAASRAAIMEVRSR